MLTGRKIGYEEPSDEKKLQGIEDLAESVYIEIAYSETESLTVERIKERLEKGETAFEEESYSDQDMNYVDKALDYLLEEGEIEEVNRISSTSGFRLNENNGIRFFRDPDYL